MSGARLAHTEIRGRAGRSDPEDERDRSWLWMLHGIYGAGRNWRTVAEELSERRSDWGCLLVDLRLHGDSPDMEPPHTLEACAGDVERLASSLDRGPRALLGHSFGAKVALRFLQDAAPAGRRPPEQVWVVDAPPGTDGRRGSADRMLRTVRSLPEPFGSREEAVTLLAEHGFERPVARWMATNLELTDGEYRWRLDWDAMEELLEDFFRHDFWGVVEDPPPATEIHVLKAEGSPALDEDDCHRVERAGARTGRVWLHRLRGGHWLNADDPEAVTQLLARRLP